MVDTLDTSFNTTNLSTLGFETQMIIKPLMPEQSEVSISIPKVSGTIQISKKFTKNTLIVIGTLTGTSYDDLITKIEALAAFLYGDTDKEIIFSNQSDRYWNGQFLEKIDLDKRNTRKAKIALIFNCNDPFAYDETPDTDDQNITVNGDTYIIANSGHYYAYPVITITFNQAQTHIYVENNSIEGNRFDISKSFETDDELEIDCKNGTVKLNGSASYAGFGDGGQELAELILLAIGDNEIEVGSDDATIDISINITFRKTYLY